MINDKGILIRNIYYMLSYSFKALNQPIYRKIEGENFDNIYDLFAEILIKGSQYLIKRGLYQAYVDKQEDLAVVRGKINLSRTFHNMINQKAMINVEYQEMAFNNLFNQILKSTLLLLIKEPSVAASRRKALKKIVLMMDEVEAVSLKTVPWSTINYHANNRHYELIINICHFVYQGMLLSTTAGSSRLPDFADDLLENHHLFESFVFNYYKQELADVRVTASQIPWAFDGAGPAMVPVMRSDIILTKGEKTKVIDTKYYSRALQSHFNKSSFHSHNLYQIYTYVKNLDMAHSGNVSGMLLYAKTGEEIFPDDTFVLDGNPFEVRVLDLNQEFAEIKADLDAYSGF